jgi:eukaryotic-like serine/threonine-protein kinase
MNERQGVMLGQYRLEAVVGRGSTATVYRGYQQSLGRYVAVKVLHPNLIPHFDVRFEREAQAVAQLQHRNILPIYDYGEQDDQRYFVTQYIAEGHTLADLSAGRPLPPLTALQLIADVLAALDYAHRRGIIHRDVKPSNILMPAPDWPLLADFGIAKLLDETRHLTPPGQMVGTAAYLAPERALGRPADARADLYSAGVVLYELVTGQVPFSAPSPTATMMMHVQAPLPPARSLNPAVPEAVDALLARALEKNPERRYQDAAAMLADVRQTIRLVEREAARAELASLLERRAGEPLRHNYDTVELTPPPGPPPRVPPPRSTAPPPWSPPTLPARPAPRSNGATALAGLAALLVGAALLAMLIVLPWLRERANAVGQEPALPPETVATAGPVLGAAPSPTPATSAPADTATSVPSATLAPTTLPTEPPAVPSATTIPTPAPSETARPAATVTVPTTPSAAPAGAPPTVAPSDDGLVRLEDTSWLGGFGGAAQPRTYGGRSATWIYGQGTGYENMRATFVLAEQPTGVARLTVEGMDSEGAAKTTILIAVNGSEVYRGPNPLPDDDLPLESGTWASYTWEFDARLLGPGPNEVSIANLSPGAFSRPPFFALDYAVLELAE